MPVPFTSAKILIYDQRAGIRSGIPQIVLMLRVIHTQLWNRNTRKIRDRINLHRIMHEDHGDPPPNFKPPSSTQTMAPPDSKDQLRQELQELLERMKWLQKQLAK